ncbi:T9SS type A sorting domain-containing protein [Kaistella sp. 97-N-M2]
MEASTLPAGIYLLRLTSSGTVTNFVKFIKK